MTKEQIIKKLWNCANESCSKLVVVKDTPKGGIWSTDASRSSVLSGGGILFIFDSYAAKHYKLWTHNDTDYSIERLAEIIMDRWEL